MLQTAHQPQPASSQQATSGRQQDVQSQDADPAANINHRKDLRCDLWRAEENLMGKKLTYLRFPTPYITTVSEGEFTDQNNVAVTPTIDYVGLGLAKKRPKK
ncbi:MAG: hypothetical protein Q9220_003932 [cf. Caloplaca sp. 1 TL-2023]